MNLQAAAYQHLFYILLISIAAYALVPGIGAFMVRSRWRKFRRLLMAASRYREPDYSLVHSGRSGSLGTFRFYGTLRALQGDDTVWLGNGSLSLKADLKGVPVYILPHPSAEQSVPSEVSWQRIHTLPEGTRIFVAGELFLQKTGAVFRSGDDFSLIAIVYEEPDEEMLHHAISAGRERNEYWNHLTPGALTAGSFSLFIYFYVLLRSPMLRLTALSALTASLLPLAPILPPALIAYSVYRSLWKKARTMRAERDLLKLKQQEWRHKERAAVRLELYALTILGFSTLLELAILFSLFSAIIR